MCLFLLWDVCSWTLSVSSSSFCLQSRSRSWSRFWLRSRWSRCLLVPVCWMALYSCSTLLDNMSSGLQRGQTDRLKDRRWNQNTRLRLQTESCSTGTCLLSGPLVLSEPPRDPTRRLWSGPSELWSGPGGSCCLHAGLWAAETGLWSGPVRPGVSGPFSVETTSHPDGQTETLGPAEIQLNPIIPPRPSSDVWVDLESRHSVLKYKYRYSSKSKSTHSTGFLQYLIKSIKLNVTFSVCVALLNHFCLSHCFCLIPTFTLFFFLLDLWTF